MQRDCEEGGIHCDMKTKLAKGRRPHPNAVWNKERQRWKLMSVWWMPDKAPLGCWCWYDWDEERVVGVCLDPDARISITVDE